MQVLKQELSQALDSRQTVLQEVSDLKQDCERFQEKLEEAEGQLLRSEDRAQEESSLKIAALRELEEKKQQLEGSREDLSEALQLVEEQETQISNLQGQVQK